MAYRVKLSRRATRDLDRIYAYITAETTPKAHNWFIGLRDLILSLESLPQRGVAYRRRPNLHQLSYGHKPHIYLILYSMDEPERVVNVVEVRHGARDS